MEPFPIDLTDAVVLEPLTDVDGVAFSVTYPDDATRACFYGFYLHNNGTPPVRIAGEDIQAFERNAFSYDIPLIIKPHSKWFTKGSERTEPSAAAIERDKQYAEGHPDDRKERGEANEET